MAADVTGLMTGLYVTTNMVFSTLMTKLSIWVTISAVFMLVVFFFWYVKRK